MQRILRFIAIATCASVITVGCKPPPTYDQAQANVGNTKDRIDQSEAKKYPPPAPVVTKSGAYVDTTKISLIKNPSWYKQHITLNGSGLPFSFYVSQILGNTSAKLHYDSTVDKNKLVSMDYSGDLVGALDELALRADYHHTVNPETNSVTWSAFISQTFDISFLPGSTDYQVGNSAGAVATSFEGGTGQDITADDQFSTIIGNVSLWEDLENTINNMLSEQGKVNVSQATTTLTVHDHPENVRAVSRYLKKMNYELSRQVRLFVQILEVRMNDQFSQGINWDLVHKSGDQAVGIAGALFDTANLNTGVEAAGVSFNSINPNGNWLSSNTIYQRLEQQGEVSILTQPTLTTLNNQVAQIAIQEQENYVNESEVTLNDNQALNSVSTATVVTGTMIYILPKVQNENVFMTITGNLSQLLDLQTFNTGNGLISTGGDTDDSESATGGNSFVQLPKLAARIFNQRAVVPTGSTLILSGFKQYSDSDNANQFFTSQALGSMSSNRQAVEIVILITPSILSTDDEIVEEFA